MTSNLSPAFTIKSFRERLDPGAIILFPYVLTICWQYFGILPSKPLAWTLAVIGSLFVWLAFIEFRGQLPGTIGAQPSRRQRGSRPRTEWQFWLIVALPLLLFFLLRIAFPDVSFDVMNYHIFHSERALRGSLFIPGDYFPTAAPFNPTPDILTGLYRYLLGYRFGTAVNFLALIWTGVIIDRLLREYVLAAWWRSLAVLFVLFTEQILFQINEYMVDLLALPLLLEATILAFPPDDDERLGTRTGMLAVFLGMATAFKLANLFIAVPIVLVYIFNLIARGDRENRSRRLLTVLRATPVSAALFFAPFAPFMIHIYRLTGNPVFPLYNGVFKSPYWPQGAAFDPRWGPWGVYETVIWPVLMYLKPYRLSEFGYYSGRLTIGYVLSAVCLFIARSNREVRAIAFITLVATIMWSASSGYIRYALYLELTSGILLVWLILYLWQKCKRWPKWARVLAQAPVWLLLFGQSFFALRHANHWEWSARETFITNREAFLREARDSFRDRSIWSYVATEDAPLFNDVDVWIETTYKTSAFAALLKPNAPMIGVRMPNYFLTNQAREKFSNVMQSVQGKRMFTLTNREGLEEARTALAARGLSLGKTRAVSINYFAGAFRFDMLLAEVLPGWQNNSGQTQAQKNLPLPDAAFKARLAVVNMPAVMRAGEKYTLRVTIRNDSPVAWPGQQPTWQFQLTVGNRWLSEAGALVTDMDGRVSLFQDLPPSETAELPLPVTAPAKPGVYILQLDAIQEGVAWFGDRGSEMLNLKVKVE